ncbi:MAG: hypothetical protein H8E22_04225 [Candidatus Cloacimonetes bacterium]|nr:hypothetical protein [Candidatus Cloacimonadota bacterium]
MIIWLSLIIAGLLLIFLELFFHNLTLLSFGVAALFTGMINILGMRNILILILLFCLFSLLNLFVLKKLLAMLIRKR